MKECRGWLINLVTSEGILIEDAVDEISCSGRDSSEVFDDEYCSVSEMGIGVLRVLWITTEEGTEQETNLSNHKQSMASRTLMLHLSSMDERGARKLYRTP